MNHWDFELLKDSRTNMQSEAPQSSEINVNFDQEAEELEKYNDKHDHFLATQIQELDSIKKAYQNANEDYISLLESLNTIILQETVEEDGAPEDGDGKEGTEKKDENDGNVTGEETEEKDTEGTEKKDENNGNVTGEETEGKDTEGTEKKDENNGNVTGEETEGKDTEGTEKKDENNGNVTGEETEEKDTEGTEKKDENNGNVTGEETEEKDTEGTEKKDENNGNVTSEETEGKDNKENPSERQANIINPFPITGENGNSGNGNGLPSNTGNTNTMSTDNGQNVIPGVGSLATAGIIGSISNQKENTTKGFKEKMNNPFGDYKLNPKTWNSLSTETQEKIIKKLKDLGFTEEEIEKIKKGEKTVPKVAIDELTEALKKGVLEHPELRTVLIEKYGFDIFNQDGTVDKDKLALALIMDEKNGKDNYSLIELLHNDYNIDIVDQTLYNALSDRLEKLGKIDANLRQKLIEKYGFDIFNSDGTINRDKLTLAILMDQQDKNDTYDLEKFLKERYGDSSQSSLLKSVKPSTSKTVKNSNNNSTLAGLGLLGAIGGGTAVLMKKEKDKKKEENEDNEDNEVSDEINDLEKSTSADNRDDKKWLYGLGIGLGTASAIAGEQKIEEIKNEKANSEEDNKINFNQIKPVKTEKKKKLFPFIGLLASAGIGAAAKKAKDKNKDENDDEL